MKLVALARAQDYLDRAGPFLTRREAENNLLLSLGATLVEQPDRYGDGDDLYLAVVEDPDGAGVLAALRTPPYKLVLSSSDRPEAVDLVAADRAPHGALPGVMARVDIAREFARAWSQATGQGVAGERLERLYQLTGVTPPRPVAGALRAACAADRALLVRWCHAFAREAQGIDDAARAERQVDFALSGGSARLSLWAEGSQVCSMAGTSAPTPTGIRIGPVYTPPELRRRGYASACVAALSQAQLDAGRQRCFLFTDLGNPTANSIYQAIGYRPVCDMAEIEFTAARVVGA